MAIVTISLCASLCCVDSCGNLAEEADSAGTSMMAAVKLGGRVSVSELYQFMPDSGVWAVSVMGDLYIHQLLHLIVIHRGYIKAA